MKNGFVQNISVGVKNVFFKPNFSVAVINSNCIIAVAVLFYRGVANNTNSVTSEFVRC